MKATITTRLIVEQSPNLNSRTRLTLKPKLDPERSHRDSFSKKFMHSKWSCVWSLENLQVVRRASGNEESILFPEITLTTSYDESERQEYLLTSSIPFSSSKSNLAKSSHPTTKLVVSLIVNHEEYLLRELADTGASSSIILEANTSAPFIKTDESNTTTWSTMGGQSTSTKTEICLWHFHSQRSTSRNKCILLENFM
jgi:hypothetical protein